MMTHSGISKGRVIVRWLTLGVMALACPVARANDEAPQLLRLQVSDMDVATEWINEAEKRSTGADGTIYDRDRQDFRPTFGFLLRGSVFHSYLLDFDLDVDLGISEEDEKIRLPQAETVTRRRDDSNPFERYDANLSILKQKPYAVKFFGSRHVTRQDNDFFTRYTLERERYGAQAGYSSGWIPFGVSVAHVDEDETDTDRPRDRKEDNLRVWASNSRGRWGQTHATFDREDFTRRETGIPTVRGIRESASLRDQERFLDDRALLLLNLYYTDLDSTFNQSRSLSVREHLRVEHAERLRSEYTFDFGRRDSGDARSDRTDMRAAVHHRLYDSLFSSAEADYRFADESGVDTRRFGGGFDERYTKRLGSIGNLLLGVGMQLHQEDREASGSAVVVTDESVTLRDGDVAFLNQPGVDPTSVRVTDPTGTIVYREGFDYRLDLRGGLATIERVIGSTILNGERVLVSYAAAGQSSDDFLTREDQVSIRLDFLNRMLAVYARRHAVNIDGGELLILNELTENVVGAEVHWRRLRAGIEYQDHDATISPFETTRIFQNAVLHSGKRSRLRFDARQSWTEYPDSDEDIRAQSYIGNYRARLTDALAFSAEGGLHKERGREEGSLDRDTVTAATEITYWIGMTTLTADYEVRDEDYLGEDRQHYRANIRVERRF